MGVGVPHPEAAVRPGGHGVPDAPPHAPDAGRLGRAHRAGAGGGGRQEAVDLREPPGVLDLSTHNASCSLDLACGPGDEGLGHTDCLQGDVGEENRILLGSDMSRAHTAMPCTVWPQAYTEEQLKLEELKGGGMRAGGDDIGTVC